MMLTCTENRTDLKLNSETSIVGSYSLVSHREASGEVEMSELSRTVDKRPQRLR